MIEAYLRANRMFVDYNEVNLFHLFLLLVIYLLIKRHNKHYWSGFNCTASTRKSILILSRVGSC